MLAEQGDGTPDKNDLLRLINEAEDNQQPLTSPSKMVALHLARGNSQFREKLKSKLSNEELHDKMEAYAVDIKSGGIAGSPHIVGTSNGVNVSSSGGALNNSGFSDHGLLMGLGGDDALLNLVSSNDASPATSKHPKMRRKRKFAGVDDSEAFLASPSDEDSSHSYLFSASPSSDNNLTNQFKTESAASGRKGEQNDGGSLIKRRKKMELHLNINDPNSNTKRGRPVKGNDKNSTTSGNVITDMGPPGDTPGKLTKLRKGKNNNNEMMSLHGGLSGQYSNPMSSLGLGGVALESPFGSVLLNSSGYPMTDLNFPLSCTADTPAKLMQFDPPLSKPMNPAVGGFDFDEVVSHFPSPRPGDSLGASPHRWSNDSTTSMGSSIFTFPDSTSNSNRDSGVGIASGVGRKSHDGLSTRSNNSVVSNSSNDHLLLSTSSTSSSSQTGNSFDAPLSTGSMTSFVNNLSSTTAWGNANFQENGGGFGPKRKKSHNDSTPTNANREDTNESV